MRGHVPYGRVDELASLAVFLDAASENPGVLVIEGQAGVGKTTLFEASLRAAVERSYRPLVARPVEAEARVSFGGLRDLLDPWFDDLDATLPAPQRHALAVALLRADPGTVPERIGAIEAGFVSFLAALAAAGSPPIVAIDDVQWLDRSSWRVVAYAMRRLSRTSTSFILTRRSGVQAEAIVDVDGALHDVEHTRIDVGPLSLGATHALLLERLGAPFSRPVVRRIYAASGGIPFDSLEVGRLLRRERTLEPGDALPVPDDIRTLVRERLRTLTEPTREALLIAAAKVDPTVAVVEAAGRGGGALDEAIEAGLIIIEGKRVRFAHPLLASGIYEASGPERRRAVHRRLADLATDVEERARHLALGSAGPDEVVAAALDEAAQAVFDRGAVDSAVELAALATELTPAGHEEALHRRRITEVEFGLKTGDPSRARVVAEAALAAAPAGDRRGEALFYRARVDMFGLDWRTPLDRFREALAEASNPHILARAELALAQLLNMSRADVREGTSHAWATARLAQQIGRDDLLAEALSLIAKQEVLAGETRTPGLIERAVELQASMSHLWVAQWPIDQVAAIAEWTDDLEGAIGAWEEVCRLAAERGDEASRVWTLWRLALVECLTGAWAAARRHVDEGLAMAARGGQVEFEAIYLSVLALLEAHAGDALGSRAAAERALELAARSGAAVARREALRARGFLALSLGRAADAHADLGPLIADARGSGIGEPSAMRYLADDIEALIELGRFAEAEGQLVWLEEAAHRLDRPSALAAAGRNRGLVLAVRGETVAAIDTVRRALVDHDRVSMPLDRARTLLVLGRIARRSKAKRVGREALEEALAVFEELGASIWAATARAELGRIAGRRPSDGRLTPTERRVAALLAEGQSTKQVAATLFITAKTVETYTSRIYAKLDVQSRASLARAIAAEQASGAKV
jgi:DNA-binding CsgD family transcriptional regulator